MKKFLVFLCAMFVLSAHATTVNIDWLMDEQIYAQTTCETGGNFALPTPTPTKYGYHFVGWQQNVVGSWSQSGTPTPTNPIEPTFRQFGNTVLRALGAGNNFVADSYNAATGKITRRVGVKVLDGTEPWVYSTLSDAFYIGAFGQIPGSQLYCTHFKGVSVLTADLQVKTGENWGLLVRYNALNGSTASFKQWLADQYAAGTPVTIYYPLATPVEENYNAQ